MAINKEDISWIINTHKPQHFKITIDNMEIEFLASPYTYIKETEKITQDKLDNIGMTAEEYEIHKKQKEQDDLYDLIGHSV